VKVLSVLLKNGNGNVFMDRENWRATQEYTRSMFNTHYLPIMTRDSSGVKKKKSETYKSKVLRVAWLGRLEDFKMPILEHTINRLDNINSLKIHLDVFGDGAGAKSISDIAKKLKRVSVSLNGNLDLDKSTDRLMEQDILFAMGTSALEGARLGIPTFCLDYSYKKISGLYKYTLLRERAGYNLAEEISSTHFEEESELEGRIDDLLKNYQKESELVYKYWKKNHSPLVILERLKLILNQTSVTVADILNARLEQADIITKLVSVLDRRNRHRKGFVLR